ncbi:hypothetical protein DRO97_06670 [Archaeoglobales archaeon]|nr:MAG: hypothetical protein DRO97_06670 [Archaeoglobales archaeon]
METRLIVESPWGKAETEAFVTWNTRQGVVAAVGGFGHWRELKADPRFPYGGFNVAVLMPPNHAEKYGGNPLLKYIKVNVKKGNKQFLLVENFFDLILGSQPYNYK